MARGVLRRKNPLTKILVFCDQQPIFSHRQFQYHFIWQ